MIKNIFLPEKIGNYYLFSKRIIGIDIGKTHINATQTHVSGTVITIERCLEEKLEPGNTNDHTQRLGQALKKIFESVDRFDEVRTALSSSLIVFKELKLPFTSHSKISMVIGFEVEPLLPFSLADAVVDFIITKTIKEEQSAVVLVAATQKQHIAQHLQIFEQAGINPHVITVDLFGLYGLYAQLPAYATATGSVALLDLGLNATRIAYIQDGQLRLIRALPHGMMNIAKTIGQTLGIPPAQALEQIIRFGLEKTDAPDYEQALKDALTTFWNKVRFTLSSFAARTGEEQPIAKLLLLGGGAEIKGLPAFITDALAIPCQLFNGEQIAQSPDIRLKNMHTIPSISITSIGAAIPSAITEQFNLRKNEFRILQTGLLLKQLITTAALILILFGSLIMYSFMQSRNLNQELQASEEEAITILQERFKALEEESIEDMTLSANTELRKEEERWFAFSRTRGSFLQYLLELTSRIDREGLGFVAEKITIAEKTITLKARVKDFEALQNLERELRKSKLFKDIEPQKDPEFIMKIPLATRMGEK